MRTFSNDPERHHCDLVYFCKIFDFSFEYMIAGQKRTEGSPKKDSIRSSCYNLLTRIPRPDRLPLSRGSPVSLEAEGKLFCDAFNERRNISRELLVYDVEVNAVHVDLFILNRIRSLERLVLRVHRLDLVFRLVQDLMELQRRDDH